MDKQSRRELVSGYKQREVIGGICAVTCSATGKSLLRAEPNLDGAQNRFCFFTSTGMCPDILLQRDWAQHGKDAFRFEELEMLEKKPQQSPAEFKDDLAALLELWREKLGADHLY